MQMLRSKIRGNLSDFVPLYLLYRRRYTSNWQLNCQATGIGGVVANKGGIVAKFDYRCENIGLSLTKMDLSRPRIGLT